MHVPVWQIPSVWIFWQSCTAESAVFTSGGLASILRPDALKGDEKCALFMVPVCRPVCIEPIFDLYTKSNAAKSLRASGFFFLKEITGRSD